MMQRLFHTSLLCFIFLISAQLSFGQDKNDLKTNKALTKTGKWECKKLQKDGREINIKAIAGIVTMDFSVLKEKKTKTITDAKGREKKKKVMEITNLFRMEMGGNDRVFNYNVKNDSIQFVSLKDWNDYRIVRVEKDELVLEHNLDNSLFRWTMVPATEPKDKKKK